MSSRFVLAYELSAQRDRDKPRQGVVAITLKLYRNGAVGFIDWLDHSRCNLTTCNTSEVFLV
jgi:hypothetical protein